MKTSVATQIAVILTAVTPVVVTLNARVRVRAKMILAVLTKAKEIALHVVSRSLGQNA